MTIRVPRFLRRFPGLLRSYEVAGPQLAVSISVTGRDAMGCKGDDDGQVAEDTNGA